MNAKQISISSYADLQKLSPEVKIVHFRKFVSKKLLESLSEICPKIRLILVSENVYSRNSAIISSIPIKVRVLQRNSGRPNLVDNFLLKMEVENSD